MTQHLGNIISHNSLTLTLLEPDGQNMKVFLLGNESRPIMVGSGPLGEGTAVDVAMQQRRPVNITDLQQTDFKETGYMLDNGLRSSLITPLITARGAVGALSLSDNSAGAFDAQDETIIQQIASLLASTIEGQRLFAEAQKQAEKERLVNAITQKIQRTVTIESALETTIQELGQALQARYTQVKLQTVQEKNSDSAN
jgi:GAF domain-containing protein